MNAISQSPPRKPAHVPLSLSWGLRQFVMALVVAVGANSATAQTKVDISPSVVNQSTCGVQFTVLSILEQTTRKMPERIWLGTADEVASLFRSTGLHPQFAELVDAGLRSLHRNDARFPTLSRMARELDASKNRKDLAVCFVSQDCDFQGGTAFHVALKPGFGFKMVQGKHAKVDDDKLLVDHLIVTKSIGSRSSPDDWLYNFSSEATHYADFILLKHWIESNQNLLAQGKSVDSLFAQFVTLQDGKAYVDEGFARVFLESREGATQQELTALAVGIENMGAIGRQVGPGAFRHIQEYPGTAREIMRSMGITERNVLDRAREFGATMEATIRSAQAPKPTGGNAPIDWLKPAAPEKEDNGVTRRLWERLFKR